MMDEDMDYDSGASALPTLQPQRTPLQPEHQDGRKMLYVPF